MINNRPWIAAFSRTGSEIYELSKRLHRFPDRIVSNSPFSNVNTQLRDEYVGEWYILPKSPTIDQYRHAFTVYNNVSDISIPIITLHGWLKVIPAEICNEYYILNGHPGDIETYPELKGFNPQEKAFNLELPTSGSIIHRVTPEVDCGEILARQKVTISGLYLEEVYEQLHSNSIDLWYKYFTSLL